MELSCKNIKLSSLRCFKDNLRNDFLVNSNLALSATYIIVNFTFLHILRFC